jgi:pimeloyl-ACP methyl ester carboxylesterase
MADQPRGQSRRGTPVAVLAHGAGSTARFVAETFAAALAAQGFDLVAVEEPSGDVAAVTARLAAVVDGCGASLVGGVSLGAHAAVRVAAVRPWLAGALLVLPAWTGPAAAVAAMSAQAGAEVARDGLDAVLARLPGGSGWPGQVADELRRAWPTYGEQALVAALLAASASAGPTVAELAAVAVPAAVVAVPADPYHPVEVARQWAGLLPVATLRELAAADLEAGPVALGRAALDAWRSLRVRSGSPSRVR